jgi:hypothetical protein
MFSYHMRVAVAVGGKKEVGQPRSTMAHHPSLPLKACLKAFCGFIPLFSYTVFPSFLVQTCTFSVARLAKLAYDNGP